MTDLISIPLKKPTEVEIVKPLKNLIQTSYSNLPSDKLQAIHEALVEFSKQRNIAIWKVFDKYENSLEIIYSYYDQLNALETKIPAQEIQIPFKWKDAFDKGTIFGGRMSLTLTSLSYEKICILFNIAALQSAVAATQSIENDDNLKLAAKLFQQSAGIYNHLKSIVPQVIAHEPTPDLNSETLTALSNLMLAQAQEIFVYKAIRDKMKDLIIAKLCCQCEELYADALKSLQRESMRTLFDKEWVITVAGKQAGFHAMTMFYHSLVSKASKSIGAEIARLQKAIELFKIAQTRAAKPNYLEEYVSKAQRNLVEAKKDNDFIYNEMIPDVNTLQSPGKAQLAKATALNGNLSQNFKDLFSDLVPVALHHALVASEARKSEIINVEVMKLRESTQILNSVLSSLNLPAAIEITESGSLPPSLLEKALTVREKGGLQQLRELIEELPESLKRNQEILDEAERMLRDEKQSDDSLRAQFKEKWSRTPSDKLTEMFRANAEKYRTIINNAVHADRVVREKFDQNLRGIDLLSKSPEELKEAIPRGAANAVGNSPAVQKLRHLMETVETVKAERDVIESELKSATIDLKDKFLQALAADGVINEPAISVSSIGKALGALQSQVQDSLTRQETLIHEIKESHQQFTNECGNSKNSNESLMSELATAYDTFTELQNNLKEGTKFYNDLTQLLIGFQNKISDYCFARKTEKEELLKDLTQESSRQHQASTPNIPMHHSSVDSVARPQESTAPPAAPAQVQASSYPMQPQGMPVPYGSTMVNPYQTYMPPPPMPTGFNPYGTLPYPTSQFGYSFPQPMQQYATFPGSFTQQQRQQQQQQPGQQPFNPNGPFF